MPLRTTPSRHDATALRFLAVAAELIDAYLHDEPTTPDRLGHIRFPTALEWLSVEDVIRLTPALLPGTNRRAFFSRWPTRAEFLPDAVVYAMLRDYETPAIDLAEPFSRVVINAADDLLGDLVRHPRSFLILHLGPLLPRHPQLSNALVPTSRAATGVWLGIHRRLAHGLDLVMRPEWTQQRMSSVLQAMLDGFVLRHRTHPGDHDAYRWRGASLLADAIIAFLLGAVDWDLTGQPGRAALDLLTRE